MAALTALEARLAEAIDGPLTDAGAQLLLAQERPEWALERIGRTGTREHLRVCLDRLRADNEGRVDDEDADGEWTSGVRNIILGEVHVNAAHGRDLLLLLNERALLGVRDRYSFYVLTSVLRCRLGNCPALADTLLELVGGVDQAARDFLRQQLSFGHLGHADNGLTADCPQCRPALNWIRGLPLMPAGEHPE
jgi:hypothetical protein